MEIGPLIRLCKKYQDLGGAVQEQLDLVLNFRTDECNLNALAQIGEWLRWAERRGVDGAGELQEEIDLIRNLPSEEG